MHEAKYRTGNLFLVGLMGAGKTTVGRLLARHLNKTFVDADHELEARTGVAIPVIFELEGEAGFRAREASLLRELVNRRNIVLATGGGAVLRPENRRLLAENGIVVYLDATVDDLWARTRHDRNRPLLQTADPRAKLAQLHHERDPLYREIADIVVTSGPHSAQHLAREIERRLAALSGAAAAHADTHR